jgi:hypothetical protein
MLHDVPGHEARDRNADVEARNTAAGQRERVHERHPKPGVEEHLARRETR